MRLRRNKLGGLMVPANALGAALRHARVPDGLDDTQVRMTLMSGKPIQMSMWRILPSYEIPMSDGSKRVVEDWVKVG